VRQKGLLTVIKASRPSITGDLVFSLSTHKKWNNWRHWKEWKLNSTKYCE